MDKMQNVIWPDREESEESPITVELVRDADDVWRVCIDGRLWPKTFDPTMPEAELVCSLPPPVRTDAALSASSTCRGVVVTCRLEHDALAPHSVELQATRIVSSDEWGDQTAKGTQSDERVFSTKQIIPYRTEGSSASATLLPFPYAASPFPVLAVIDYRQLEQEYGAAVRFLSAASGTLIDLATTSADTFHNKEFFGVKAFAKNWALVPKMETPLKFDVKLFGEAGRRPAHDELRRHFKVMRDAFAICRERTSLKDFMPRVQYVRLALARNGEDKALRLFEYILLLDPKTLPKKPADGNGDQGGPSQTVTGATTANAASTATGANATVEFDYSRMNLVQRRRTTVRLEYVVTITEIDGTIRHMRLRPTQYDACLAFTVLAGLPKARMQLEEEIDALSTELQTSSDAVPAVQQGTPTASGKLLHISIDEKNLGALSKDLPINVTQDGFRRSLEFVQRMCCVATGEEMPVDATVGLAEHVEVGTVAYTRILPQLAFTANTESAPLARIPMPEDTSEPPSLTEVTMTGSIPFGVRASGLVLTGLAALGSGLLTFSVNRASNAAAHVLVRAATASTATASGGVGLGYIFASGFGTLLASLMTPVVSVPAAATAIFGGLLLKGTVKLGDTAWDAIKKTWGNEFIQDKQMMSMQNHSFAVGLNVWYVLQTAYVAYSVESAKSDDTRSEARRSAALRARGTPVVAAVHAAQIALNALHQQDVRTRRLSNGLHRFTFRQDYEYRGGGDEQGVQFGFILHENRKWQGVPRPGMWLSTYPRDIDEKEYEFSILRGRTVPAELHAIASGGERKGSAADAAATRVRVATFAHVSAGRFTRHTTQLIESVDHEVRERLVDASELLSVAYEKSVWLSWPVVYGDDILWSCCVGGAAARLALREMNAFQDTNDEYERKAELASTHEKALRALHDNVRGATREVADARDRLRRRLADMAVATDTVEAENALVVARSSYSDALRSASAEIVKLVLSQPYIEHKNAMDTINADLRRLWTSRVRPAALDLAACMRARPGGTEEPSRTLTRSDAIRDRVFLSMLRTQTRMLAMGDADCRVLIALACELPIHERSALHEMEAAVDARHKHTTVAVPKKADVLSVDAIRASFAARRLDVEHAHGLRIGSGTSAIVDMLADTRVESDGALFLCAANDTLGSLATQNLRPNDTAFERVTKLGALADALRYAARCLTPQGHSYAPASRILRIEKYTRCAGLARHPFVVRKSRDLCEVHLSESHRTTEPLGASAAKSFAHIDEALLSNGDLAAQLTSYADARDAAKNCMSHNAARFKWAIALQRLQCIEDGGYGECDTHIAIRVRGTPAQQVDTAFAVALALHLLAMETGWRENVGLMLECDNEESIAFVHAQLHRASRACDDAVESGHPVVMWQEALLALSGVACVFGNK